jgi:dihydroflavonol-4-reductase
MATRPDSATTGQPIGGSLRSKFENRNPKFEGKRENPNSKSSAVTSLTSGNHQDPDPSEWPVLVTGAGGFVGGHVARALATAGHVVRAVSRRAVAGTPGDAPIEWALGDLMDGEFRRRVLQGMRGVVHAAGWVSLGPDVHRTSHSSNVEITRSLLADAAEAGVGRFVYTSTLYTLAAGTPDRPADESTDWNLGRVDSPYTRTKRIAEGLVLEASRPGFTTIALCPGMVLGPSNGRPTSTKIVRAMSRTPVAFLPPGGIPIVDAAVLALAHRRALIAGGDGQRYAVVGPYLSYPELARIVAAMTGRPKCIVSIPDSLEPTLGWTADVLGFLSMRRLPNISRELVAGGFLRLHVSGARADACFGLVHPPAIETISRSLT